MPVPRTGRNSARLPGYRNRGAARGASVQYQVDKVFCERMAKVSRRKLPDGRKAKIQALLRGVHSCDSSMATSAAAKPAAACGKIPLAT